MYSLVEMTGGGGGGWFQHNHFELGVEVWNKTFLAIKKTMNLAFGFYYS